MYDERTSKGLIRRWSLVNGEPRALEDALPLDHDDTPTAIGRNVMIFDLLAAVDLYRERIATPTPNLNRQRQTITLEGYHYEPEPAWLAYDEMRAALAATPEVVKALDVILTPHAPVDDPEANAAMLDSRDEANELVQLYIEAAPAIAPLFPVPVIVSDRQFFHAAALMGVITPAEALEAVKTGTIPALLEQIVAGMPEEPQFNARMVLSGAVEFRRDHPLVQGIGDAIGWTSDQIDDLYRLAGALI